VPSETPATWAEEETAPETTTAPPPTTTQAPTTVPAPSSVAEIVAYYNRAANQVKTRKPGMTYQKRTKIEAENISSQSTLVNIAKPFLDIAKDLYSDWSNPIFVPAGTDHDNDFVVVGQTWASRLEADWVDSATCTQDEDRYVIEIRLKTEDVPELPEDGTSTRHGQVYRAFTVAEIADGAKNVGVNIERFACKYIGSYVRCEVDIKSGQMKRAHFYNYAETDVSASFGITIQATIPLIQETEYTIG
jgi:hypothetical protein